MTISTGVANSVCAKFDRDGVVSPGLTKNTFTVGMVDHVDHNPSSTAAQHMPGTDCGPETPLTDSTTQGKRCVVPLPSTYTLVPEVEAKKHLTVPAVTVPCMRQQVAYQDRMTGYKQCRPPSVESSEEGDGQNRSKTLCERTSCMCLCNNGRLINLP